MRTNDDDAMDGNIIPDVGRRRRRDDNGRCRLAGQQCCDVRVTNASKEDVDRW
jgi:hypothetical protein